MAADDAKLLAVAPILLVADVLSSANYYRDRLGFSYDRFWGEPATFCILNRGGCSIMLKQVEDTAFIVPHYRAAENLWNVYVWVDDVDALYEEMVSKGANIDYELCEQGYGCREFGVQDLDGYDIAFGQVMDRE